MWYVSVGVIDAGSMGGVSSIVSASRANKASLSNVMPEVWHVGGEATSTFKGTLYSSVFILVLLCVRYDAIGQSFVLVIIVHRQGDPGFQELSNFLVINVSPELKPMFLPSREHEARHVHSGRRRYCMHWLV